MARYQDIPDSSGITGINLDLRDRFLSRHMHQRLALASGLPPEKQIHWAQKCRDLALCQHRTAFFLMACMWLSTIKTPLT